MGKCTVPISVIMLTYNRENLVERAIGSILSQTLADFEYIIVDNGSSDKSGEICKEYAKRDSRIKLVRRETGNIGSGRNAGLDLAEGEYITFIDDDDVAEADMLEFLYDMAKSCSADISICGSTKEVDGEIFPNCVFAGLLEMDAAQAVVELLKRKKYNSASPTKMWHRKLFDVIRYKNEGKYDDIAVIYKLISEAGKIVARGEPKYCFCRHDGNNSDFTTNDKLLTPCQLDEYYSAFRERTEYLSKKLPQIADYVHYSEWSYLISMCNKIISNDLYDCSAQLEYAKQVLIRHYDEFYFGSYIAGFEKEWMDKYIKEQR